ncbi:copper chaperone PCu(A)C [Rhodococcus chondri]|uniref:Copper chaperone PCu(A)C n=1 Tax=Rhodococcus chondri TaxID=3065941 RepID=A0ABU7JP09_9NOCA|nr:copper chaperone PCu(A)C [Rhodococcus sp. CC-R104]MEE2031763.1 copper chaperone PCu(A)C [Rhodococcus sp. CC-R104]
MKKTLFYTAAAATALLTATACGSDTTTPTAAETVTVSSAWAKAAESGMTGAFAELENSGDADVHVVAASSPSATRTELHEMAGGDAGAMVMREMADGLTVAAGTSHSLAPGSDHLMLMDLIEPVTPGTEVTFTLTFDDGSTKDFTAQVRDFAGAQENYEPSSGGMNHGG